MSPIDWAQPADMVKASSEATLSAFVETPNLRRDTLFIRSSNFLVSLASSSKRYWLGVGHTHRKNGQILTLETQERNSDAAVVGGTRRATVGDARAERQVVEQRIVHRERRRV